METLGLGNYFDENNTFTIDHVGLKGGKPQPDIFLYAARHMGFEPKDCLVIEDGIPGLIAAEKAGMERIAFTQYQGNSTDDFTPKTHSIGIKHICHTMLEIKTVLESL